VAAAGGRDDRVRPALQQGLDVARRIGNLSLEARFRVALARMDVGGGRFGQALQELRLVPEDGASQALERELRAQLLQWRARARAGAGDAAGAAVDHMAAEGIVRELAGRIDALRQPAFLGRGSILEIIGSDAVRSTGGRR
jgi:hypothetical protein